jgi:hypothetical protein
MAKVTTTKTIELGQEEVLALLAGKAAEVLGLDSLEDWNVSWAAVSGNGLKVTVSEKDRRERADAGGQ